jgi:uncharacterized protein YutE (UPF0331/DUF86 family)
MTRKTLTIVSRINEEVSELDRIYQRILKGWESSEKSRDDLYLDSVALNLHSFYSCIERIFELIARNIDQSIPQGESWHQELLKQMMTDIKLVRPAVISRDTFTALDEYRGFRHIVRNVYTFNLSQKKLQPLITDLQSVYEKVVSEISAFIKIVQQD